MKNVIEKKECINNVRYIRVCIEISFLRGQRAMLPINYMNGYKYLSSVRRNADGSVTSNRFQRS